MTSRLRALLGAAAGALLVLIAHPSTRPGMLTVFRPLPSGGLDRLLARPRKPIPTDLDSAAAYLHAGAIRLESGPALTPRERQTLIAIAVQGEARESDNPFWPLALYVFRGGKDAPARAAWRRASGGKRYFDHQRSQLEADRTRVAARVGDTQGWIYAAVATQRSDAMINRIRLMAMSTLRGLRSKEERLEFAYETIRNGALVRDGSERLTLGRLGIAMIEAAPYPPGILPAGKSPTLRLWIAKTTLTADLRAERRVADASFCDRQFRTNDSWEAFQSVTNTDDRFTTLALLSVVVAALPGALLGTSMAGGLVWILARRAERLARRSLRFHGSGITALSLSLLVAGTVLGFPTIGLTAGACALVSAFSPERPRRYRGDPLGPLHVLVVGTLVVALGGALTVALIARSLPGQIFPDLGYYGAVMGNGRRWGAVVVILLGASTLAAPAWASVRRYPTAALAAVTYRDLGRGVALAGFGFAILTSPLSLALDRWLGDSLAKIALNEQNAYGPRGLGGD